MTIKPKFFRGVGTLEEDWSDRVISNRPRSSTSWSGFKMALFDHFVDTTTSVLQNAPYRSDCLIFTTNPDHAELFGCVYEIDVLSATRIAWSMQDFNDISELVDMECFLEDFAEMFDVDISDGNVLSLDQLIGLNSAAKHKWKQLTKQNQIMPSEWVIQCFSSLLDRGEIGVCEVITDVPATANEIWIQGTAKIIKPLHENSYNIG